MGYCNGPQKARACGQQLPRSRKSPWSKRHQPPLALTDVPTSSSVSHYLRLTINHCLIIHPNHPTNHFKFSSSYSSLPLETPFPLLSIHSSPFFPFIVSKAPLLFVHSTPLFHPPASSLTHPATPTTHRLLSEAQQRGYLSCLSSKPLTITSHWFACSIP